MRKSLKKEIKKELIKLAINGITAAILVFAIMQVFKHQMGKVETRIINKEINSK